METTLREQARALYETVRLLRLHVATRLPCCAPLGDGGPEEGMDLTMPQMNALLVIRGHSQVSIKQLAEALQVSAPSASAMVDRLVDMGAVTREQSRIDRREVAVQISPKAAQLVDRTEEGILQTIVELMEEIGPEYSQKWCEVYDKLHEVLLKSHIEAHSATELHKNEVR